MEDGRVLLVGGSGWLPAELHDPAAGTFRPTGACSTERQDATAARLAGGQVIVIGGIWALDAASDAEEWDPGTGMFSQVGNMTYRRGSAELYQP